MKKQEADTSCVSDLGHRFSRLEELMNKHSHELAIQFERIAQIQAALDILRGGLLDAKLREPSENQAETTEESDQPTT